MAEHRACPPKADIELADVVRRFGAAWQAWDLEAVMALMSDDAVFESTGPAPDGVRRAI
jgi:ketosteroid isomerase-like protein